MNTKEMQFLFDSDRNNFHHCKNDEMTKMKLEEMFELHKLIQEDIQIIRKLSLQLGFAEARLSSRIDEKMKLAKKISGQ